MAKLKPNEFWSRIKKRNRPVDSDFHDYFSAFSNSSSDHNLHNYACTNTHIYDLDKPITGNEVEKVICYMSRGKSSGLDDLINEMFIDSRDIFLPYLARIFNHLFDNSLYPAEWLKGKIVPIPKKCDLSNVSNYRGIKFISVFSIFFRPF